MYNKYDDDDWFEYGLKKIEHESLRNIVTEITGKTSLV